MVLHPEVQRKAQAEIDAVVGCDRLPNISDRDSLPYVRSLVAETFRWSPAIPLGYYLSIHCLYFFFYLLLLQVFCTP